MGDSEPTWGSRVLKNEWGGCVKRFSKTNWNQKQPLHRTKDHSGSLIVATILGCKIYMWNLMLMKLLT